MRGNRRTGCALGQGAPGGPSELVLFKATAYARRSFRIVSGSFAGGLAAPSVDHLRFRARDQQPIQLRREITVNKKFMVGSAATGVAALVLAGAVSLRSERLHAQPRVPLDECTRVGDSPGSRLCLHVFADRTKCVISVTRGTETSGITTTALACKFPE